MEYRISGIWTDQNGVITHYAFHTRKKKESGSGYTIGKAVKKTKSEAIVIVENKNNSVKTYMWNYTERKWNGGEDVYVANEGDLKFLKTKPDSSVRDNLLHLIDYSYIY